MTYIGHFYLDSEKDILITLYRDLEKIYYTLRTPNHSSGNLIRNIAKVADLKLLKDENELFYIADEIPCFVTSSNREVYQLRFKDIKIADIYLDGRIDVKTAIPAVMKTLMSQTKDYRYDIHKTIVKTYIPKDIKFRSDLHTHMNANLTPDLLIALAIHHQIRYPYYYIKKLKLKLSASQEEMLESKRKEVKKQYLDSKLTGKYLDRKIDDNTFINFADLILCNGTDAQENIHKIRTSLSILKDGQAVFTNLEKVYVYRYVFTKGIRSDYSVNPYYDDVPSVDIKAYLLKMRSDYENPIYRDYSLFQNKLLWIARSYQAKGINYVEMTDTTLTKKEGAVKMLEEVHNCMPAIYKETGVMIRFLAGIRRIPLNLIKDNATPDDYLRENVAVIKAIASDPYVAGSDIIGEEINDISEVAYAISKMVEINHSYPGFVIRIHAGENDSLKSNVSKSIDLVLDSLKDNQKMPEVRLGHGLYTENLASNKGKALIEKIRNNNVVLEFQITSNIRLNNLNDLKSHPLKKYLEEGLACVQGTDGCGMYGTDSIEEQLSLDTLLDLCYEELKKMKDTEDILIKNGMNDFEYKSHLNYDKVSLMDYYQNLIHEYWPKDNSTIVATSDSYSASKYLKQRYKEFPDNKYPIVLAGGSFNTDKRLTRMTDHEIELIDALINNLNPDDCFFVIGHKLNSYEKYLYEQAKDKFEIYAIVPSLLSRYELNKILDSKLFIHISPENTGMGIYKSFNYEIFERGHSVLIALDGNSAGANMIQEAKNGKGKARIYVAANSLALKDKALSLKGYLTIFTKEDNILDDIMNTIAKWKAE